MVKRYSAPLAYLPVPTNIVPMGTVLSALSSSTFINFDSTHPFAPICAIYILIQLTRLGYLCFESIFLLDIQD